MKKPLLLILLFPLLTLLSTTAWSQCTVKGTLFDDANGEAIPFANVVLEVPGTTTPAHGCATDLGGFFLINKVPQGTYVLRVRYMGYEEYSDTVVLVKNRTVTHTIRLKPAAQTLKTVEIKANKVEERRSQTQVSVEKLTSSQIQQMPSIGGTADIAQYMQVLPGVSSTGDQGGQLYIRGGSMIQNLTLLDGMIVYNPFHSIGLYSIFETDIILNADIYTGGFGAEYGGRMSSVMDITTRDGNKRRHSGKLGVNTFGASLILEGPLKRESTQSKATISYLLSAKNSFLSKSSEVLYNYVDGGLPFDFLDLYGKLSFNSGTGSKFNLFGFRFDDRVDGYQNIADYHWQSYGAGTNFMLVTGASAILDGSVAYSNYSITLDDHTATQANDNKYSSISGFNMSMQITNFIGNNKMKYGLSIEGYNTDYQFTGTDGKGLSQKEPSTTLSMYGTYNVNTGRLIADPGIRAVYYATLGTFSLEPRLAAKYNLSPDLRFKFATGLYSQIFLDARSDNDIVNLFSGFLTGSGDLHVPSTFRGDEVTTTVQKAKHLVIGAEYDLTEHITLNAEFYYKHFDQLLNANRNKLYDDTDPYYSSATIGGQDNPNYKPEYLRKDYIIEEGQASGFDISATVDLERLYLWATYSLGFVERTDELQTYSPHYDRRHTVNLLATYALGAWREWEVSARWTFGSGFPFTQTQGIFQQLLFPSYIASDYTQENGQLSLHYGDLYKGNLPSYHRLDVGVKRKFSLSTHSILELSLSATNVYSRENIFYFNRTTFERVNQLPILVYFGTTMTF
ncbi:MAG: TonB-dependent receptor [Bacteroidales bacterium]|nr:TonB-dependent receptor [Bacteroidales bacterium]